MSLDGPTVSRDIVQRQLNNIRAEHTKYLPKVQDLIVPPRDADENCVDLLTEIFFRKGKIPW